MVHWPKKACIACREALDTEKMSIAEKLRSLDDQLVRERNNKKALCLNMFQTKR